MTEERQPTRFTVWKCSKCGYEATQPFTRQHLTNTYRYCGEAPEKTDLVPASDLNKALAALRETEKVVEVARLVIRNGADTGSLNYLGRVVKALDELREPV